MCATGTSAADASACPRNFWLDTSTANAHQCVWCAEGLSEPGSSDRPATAPRPERSTTPTPAVHQVRLLVPRELLERYVARADPVRRLPTLRRGRQRGGLINKRLLHLQRQLLQQSARHRVGRSNVHRMPRALVDQRANGALRVRLRRELLHVSCGGVHRVPGIVNDRLGGLDVDRAVLCHTNFWMDSSSGTATCTSCVDSTAPFTGSTSIADCVCNANFWKVASTGSCTQCVDSTITSTGSTSIIDCVCNTNFWRDVAVAATPVCRTCGTNGVAATANQPSSTICDCTGAGSTPIYDPVAFACAVKCPVNHWTDTSASGSFSVCKPCMAHSSTLGRTGVLDVFKCECDAQHTGSHDGRSDDMLALHCWIEPPHLSARRVQARHQPRALPRVDRVPSRSEHLRLAVRPLIFSSLLRVALSPASSHLYPPPPPPPPHAALSTTSAS